MDKRHSNVSFLRLLNTGRFPTQKTRFRQDFQQQETPITVAILITIAVLSLLYNPAKVLAALMLLLLTYLHPLPALLSLTALLSIYYLMRKYL